MIIRYRIWHDGTGMKNPFKGYFAGWIDTIKEAKERFNELSKKHKGELRLDEFGASEKFIKSIKHRK